MKAIVDGLEVKIKKLISLYEKEKQERELAVNENDKLKEELDEKHKVVKSLEEKIKIIKREVSFLRPISKPSKRRVFILKSMPLIHPNLLIGYFYLASQSYPPSTLRQGHLV